ncbi:MAG: spore coat protein U domain-containing protein [Verrucomicrobia bacterium]|nr:spore coat protein U domain-containing protein [Verrucomicrobiota bacterium]
MNRLQLPGRRAQLVIPAAKARRSFIRHAGAQFRRCFLGATALLLFAPCFLLADNNLFLQIAGVEWRGKTGAGYDVFDPMPYLQTVNFTVRHTGSAGSYFITFSKNSAGNTPRLLTSGASTLNYQLYDTASLNNVLKDLPAAAPNEVLSGSFGSGNDARQLSFVMAMPSLQIKPDGTYTDSVRVSVYDGTLAHYTLAQSVVIQITARVPQLTGLSIVPTGGGFDPLATTQLLDFGTLTEGKSLGLDLRVRSNAGYSVSLQSENQGALKNTAAGLTDTVPYTMQVGGAVVTFTSQAEVVLARRGVITGATGDAYPVQVTIGPTGDASAGNYRDIVTITVRAEN